MKQYKHKITGNLATLTNSGKNYRVTEPQNYTIPAWIIENSTDWEPVEINNWSVEIYKHKDGRTFVKQSNSNDFKCTESGILYNEAQLIMNTNYFIGAIGNKKLGVVIALNDTLYIDDVFYVINNITYGKNGFTVHDDNYPLSDFNMDYFTTDIPVISSSLFEIRSFIDVAGKEWTLNDKEKVYWCGNMSRNFSYSFSAAQITSVKRIRDNKIFKLGDCIAVDESCKRRGFLVDHLTNQILTIKKIEINFGNLKNYKTKNGYGEIFFSTNLGAGCWVPMCCVKEPEILTEDGYTIPDGVEVFRVFNAPNNKVIEEVNTLSDYSKNYKYFLTNCAAEEFVKTLHCGINLNMLKGFVKQNPNLTVDKLISYCEKIINNDFK